MRSTSGTICCHFFCSAVFSMPVCRKPTVGSADTTFSPSSSSTSRNTPCVLGCCGPMLTVIVSVRSSGMGSLDQIAHDVQHSAMYFLDLCARLSRHRHGHVHEVFRLAAVAARQTNRRQAGGPGVTERVIHIRGRAARRNPQRDVTLTAERFDLP